jgi:hypothetical protein
MLYASVVGIEPDPKTPVFEDDHIVLTLNAFNTSTGLATAYVHEKDSNVGRYRVLMRFDSGHEVALRFDGSEKYRTAFLIARTPHTDDGVAQIEVRSVATE